jgi:hypothetical protein
VLKSRRRSAREPSHRAESLETANTLPSSEPTPSDQAMSKEEESLVWRSLERIPEHYREALVLFYQEDQSVERVAMALGLSEDAAKQRLCRGRRRLREQVTALMERALKGSKPGDGFTASVLAALPSLPAPLQGTSLALAALKSGLTSWLALLGVLGGGYIGWKAEMATARSERERRFLVRKAGVLCLGAALILLGLHFGWWTILANLTSRFGHDVAQISILFGLAVAAVVQQGWFSTRQDQIRVEDGTQSWPDPIASGPKWCIYSHVAQRMAALLAVVVLMAIEAVSEQEWLAGMVGLLLVPLFVWLGVRRWRIYQRDKASAVRRGMIGTVAGFFCLTLLQYNLPHLNNGILGWDAATVAFNLAVALLYGILLLAVILRYGGSLIREAR